MDPKDFKLQRIYVFCAYPESPIFLEKAGLVVNQHLDNYAEFVRGSTGFYLADEKERIRVRLLSAGIDAQVESLSPEKLTLFSRNSHALIRDMLEQIGFSNVTSASSTYTYFRQLMSPDEVAKALADNFLTVPREYSERLGNDIVDWHWGVVFPYRNDLQCGIGLSMLLNEQEVKNVFLMSAEECGRGGIIVKLEFAFPPEKEAITLEELGVLFRVAEDDAFDIASMVIESIKE